MLIDETFDLVCILMFVLNEIGQISQLNIIAINAW